MTHRELAPPGPEDHPRRQPVTPEGQPNPARQPPATDAAAAAPSPRAETDDARLGVILERLPDGFFTLDHALRFTYINAAAARLWHHSGESLIGRALTDALPSLAGSATHQAVTAALAEGRTIPFVEHSRTHHAWAAGRAYPAPDGVAVLVQDISAARQAEIAIQKSEERYRTLLNSIDIGFCVFDVLVDAAGTATDYRFLEANPVFEQLTGLSGVLGRSARELIPNLEDFWIETYGIVATTGIPIRFEQQSAALDGRWFDVYACRLGGDDSRRVAVLFTNITERKQLERAQQDLVGMVGHDLGNPLTVVRSWAQLLRRRQTYDAAGVATIIEQTQRMERLVSDLREYVQFETDRVELLRAPADLAALARTAVERASVQAPAHRLRLAAPAAPVMVSVDAGRIGQVLDNLLSNASKYSPAASEITIRLEAGAGEAHLHVSDQGRGIPAAAVPRLFDRFFRVSSPSGANGVGLGLYISRMLVEAHGGRISAVSDLGRGSTFTVTLPLAAPSPE